MRHSKTLIIAISLAFYSMFAAAQEFTITSSDGRQMHFSVIDEASATVALSRGGYDTNLNYAPTGTLTVPVAVQNGKKSYKVVAIAERALAGSDMLKAVILPSTISRIESAAFENCIFLSELILPGSNTVIAEDAFNGCSALKSIRIGSDCTYIDFTPFKDCQSLKEINIPSKVKNIVGISSLSSVVRFSVEETSPYYASVDGMLYDKSQTELVYCPVDCPRELVIPEGTVTIRRGALAGCSYVEKVFLPASLKSVAYDEFKCMRNLKSISFASENVSVTGQKDGRDVFALELDSEVEIFVRRKSLKHYRIAIENGDGVYVASDGFRKNMTAEGLASADQIKRNKLFIK